MKTKLCVLALSLLIPCSLAWAIPTEINYQGTLKQSGLPVNGNATLKFTLTSQDGNTPYSNSIVITTNVVNGLFSTKLDFQLLSGNTWESMTPYIKVNVNGQDLAPAEKVSAAPYALVSNAVVDGAIAPAQVTNGFGLVPSGALIPFAGPIIPSGWLLCDGSSVSRAIYPNLFAAIGTTWGSVDSATFNLPDLRGRTPIGTGQGVGLTNRVLGDSKIGEEFHKLTISEMPAHAHGVTDPGHSHNLLIDTTPGINQGVVQVNEGVGSFVPVHPIAPSFTGISIQNAGGDGTHNIMQPSAVVNFIIKI